MNRRLCWPYQRESTKISLERIYDFEFQKNWYSATAKHRFFDSLIYYIFEFLYDNAYEDAEKTLGLSLYNQEEIDLINNWISFFDDEFKANQPDSYYTNHPLWQKLIDDAKHIVALMEENEKKYDYDADVEDYNLELYEEERKALEDLRNKQIKS